MPFSWKNIGLRRSRGQNVRDVRERLHPKNPPSLVPAAGFARMRDRSHTCGETPDGAWCALQTRQESAQ